MSDPSPLEDPALRGCPSDAAPRVSVIVAAFRSEKFLPRCLAALARQTYRNFETIVVNSSTGEETAKIVSGFPCVSLIQSPQRLLPHAAINAGAAAAKGSILVFTVADTASDPGWLDAMVASSAAGREIIGGSIETRARRRLARGINILKYSPYLRGRPSGPLKLAASGNMLVTRRAWKIVGPFDGSIYSGDSFFSWRAREAGLNPWYESNAVVFDLDESCRWNFFPERFRRGREFGKVRASFKNWSRIQRTCRVAGTPLAILSALSKTGRECRRAGRLADFLATLPFQLLGQVFWCSGEALGYAAPQFFHPNGTKAR